MLLIERTPEEQQGAPLPRSIPLSHSLPSPTSFPDRELCLVLSSLHCQEAYEQLSLQQERLVSQHKSDLGELQDELKRSQIRCSDLQVSVCFFFPPPLSLLITLCLCVKESQALSKAQSESACSERLKLKLEALEEELEAVKKQSLRALETERSRCSEEIERMREAFNEKLSEGHAREVALSQQISDLQVVSLSPFLPSSVSPSPSLRSSFCGSVIRLRCLMVSLRCLPLS
jgi:hypothetical protein